MLRACGEAAHINCLAYGLNPTISVRHTNNKIGGTQLTKETRINNETTIQTHIKIIPELNFKNECLQLHTVRVTRVVVIVVAFGDHCCWTSWLSTFVVISVCFSYELCKRSGHCCCLLMTITVELLTINFCRPQVVLVETIGCEWVAELKKKHGHFCKLTTSW